MTKIVGGVGFFIGSLCVGAVLYTVAQKTAPIFAYYIKTHVLLNADITSLVYILNHVI